ncbi:hypothetical protein K3495_g11716, partial [Podosphaera aphanis]
MGKENALQLWSNPQKSFCSLESKSKEDNKALAQSSRVSDSLETTLKHDDRTEKKQENSSSVGGLARNTLSLNTMHTEILPEGVTPTLPPTKSPRYMLRKRKRINYTDNVEVEDEDDECRTKLIRAMLAIVQTDETYDHVDRLDEYATFAAPIVPEVSSDFKQKLMTEFTTLVATRMEISDEPDDIALPAEVFKGIKITRTYRQAINDKQHAIEWRAAINDEIRSLIENGTWEELILPEGANLVSTKWVFTVKTKDGKVERFKARLVARGFSQIPGKDYSDTFAPTARMDTLRLFLALVTRHDLECRQFDIKNAFTESTLKEEIYLAPPEGLEIKKGHVLRALR